MLKTTSSTDLSFGLPSFRGHAFRWFLAPSYFQGAGHLLTHLGVWHTPKQRQETWNLSLKCSPKSSPQRLSKPHRVSHRAKQREKYVLQFKVLVPLRQTVGNSPSLMTIYNNSAAQQRFWEVTNFLFLLLLHISKKKKKNNNPMKEIKG